ncbi:PilZ domain-containing protein [bacterium]|nr:PilZ domain-containing protein [bacterium]
MFWRKKDAQENRRKYVRLEKSFKVKYGIIKIDKEIPVQFDLLDSVELKYNGHTKDICEGGLCLENEDLKKLLRTSIKEGTELKLRILISGEDMEDIDTVGRVIWTDLEKDVCGIKFTFILNEDCIKIRNYVRDEYVKNYKR